MADHLKSTYVVKHFTDSKDKDFQKALQIYKDTIPVDIKTSTNEIIYFVDNPDIQPERTMYFWGLLVNSEVIGFAEAGFLHNTKTVVLDYIVIKSEYHLNSSFYPLFGLLLNYISSERIDYNFIATEIGDDNCDDDPEMEYVFLKRMLSLEDFKVIENYYIQPKLGTRNNESNKEFKLMIKSERALSSLRTDTYLAIVHDIYYNHYLTWYSVFEKQHFDEYKEHIDEQYSNVASANEGIEIKLSYIPPECKYYTSSDCYFKKSTAGFKETKKPRSRLILLISIPLIIVVAFLFTWLIVVIMDILQISSTAFEPVLAVVTAICTSIVTMAFTKVKND